MDIFKRKATNHDEYIHYLIQVQQAREQWQNSIKYFESVCEEDLVEYAIYEMEAAKRRYICMLTRLRGMYFELKKNRETYLLQDDTEDMKKENLSIEDTSAKITNLSGQKAINNN